MFMTSGLESNSQFCAIHYATADAFDVPSLQVQVQAGPLVYVRFAHSSRNVDNFSKHDVADHTPVKNTSVKKLRSMRYHFIG